MKRKIITAAILSAFLFSVIYFFPVRADVAPPQQPPGSSVGPEGDTTQVRMMAETVIINILKDVISGTDGQALIDANFTMRNLGNDTEYMNVRFPLADPSGFGDGWGNNPTIRDFQVKVNGERVKTSKISAPATGDSEVEIPWESFLVAFPPGEDVDIQVIYTIDGTGYGSGVDVGYVLETGAGWKDTIGSADIVLHMPYDATFENVKSAGFSGYDEIQPVVSGQEMRWHAENFEPDSGYNFNVSVVKPALWLAVLNELDRTTKNAQDGEAWGRLGKAYKEIVVEPKGYLSDNKELYRKAYEAYFNAVNFKPNDADWHAGFADLLWSHYITYGWEDNSALVEMMNQLDQSLALDPQNELANSIFDWASSTIPEMMYRDGNSFAFPGLTATPTPVTPPTEYVPEVASSTPTPVTPRSTRTPPPSQPDITTQATQVSGEEAPSGQICGGAALVLPIMGAAWAWRRKIRM